MSPIAGTEAFAIVADLPADRRLRRRRGSDYGRPFCSVLVIRNGRDIRQLSAAAIVG